MSTGNIGRYIHEIISRIVIVTISWTSTAAVGYAYRDNLVFLATHQSLGSHPLLYTNAYELISAYQNLIFFVSFKVGFSFLAAHTIFFLSPALFKTEYSFLKKLLSFSGVAALFSLAVAHMHVVPTTWSLLSGIGISDSIKVQLEAKLNEYLSFHLGCLDSVFFFSIFLSVLSLTFQRNFNRSYREDGYVILRKLKKFFHCSSFILAGFISLSGDMISLLGVGLTTAVTSEVVSFFFLFTASKEISSGPRNSLTTQQK